MSSPITTFKQVIDILPSNWESKLIEQGKQGDPDWFRDLLSEISWIEPGSSFYLKDFHSYLKPFTKDLDIDAIFNDYLSLLN